MTSIAYRLSVQNSVFKCPYTAGDIQMYNIGFEPSHHHHLRLVFLPTLNIWNRGVSKAYHLSVMKKTLIKPIFKRIHTYCVRHRELWFGFVYMQFVVEEIDSLKTVTNITRLGGGEMVNRFPEGGTKRKENEYSIAVDYRCAHWKLSFRIYRLYGQLICIYIVAFVEKAECSGGC